MANNVGEAFQEGTKYDRGDMDFAPLDWCKKPDVYKSYDGAEKIALRRDVVVESMPVLEALATRRSVRRFSNEGLSFMETSVLLWAASGIQRVEHGYAYRTAPSAGALYPIETYVVAQGLESICNGIYHYCVSDHLLDTVRRGDLMVSAARAALDQTMCEHAPLMVIWAAVFDRSKWKYKQRAYRYIYLDAGHMAQNLALAATGLGLGSCQIGAFYDEELNELIGIDSRAESVVYASIVGRPL